VFNFIRIQAKLVTLVARFDTNVAVINDDGTVITNTTTVNDLCTLGWSRQSPSGA